MGAVYPIKLGGREYLIDTALPPGHSFRFSRGSVPTVREQQDTGDLPGEQSLSREDLWRRAQETWHGGAGQAVLDRLDATPLRFRTSKGIDPFDKWELKLLKETTQKAASADASQGLLVVGNYLYYFRGTVLEHTQDITVGSPAFTSAVIQAGEVAQNVKAIATDGRQVYAALGTNFLHRTTRGAATSTHYWTPPAGTSVDLVAFVKGRLMATAGFRLYNVTGSAAQNELTPTDFNSDWAWTAFGEAPRAILCAGFSGDKSRIYAITITPEGTKLGAPIEVGSLPDGEIVRSLGYYLGAVIIGTDKGVRLAQSEGGGLAIGPLVNLDQTVRCFEAQDRFVWFGWTNYDSGSTGLGRLDLLTFTQPLTAAYASDLMASAQGAVSAVGTFQGRRVFTVNGNGLWAEGTNLVASGTIETGSVAFSLPDPKVAFAVDVRHKALNGTVVMALSADGGAYADAVTSSTAGSTSPGYARLAAPVKAEQYHEVKLTLTRSATDATKGPKVSRWTLFARPVPRKADVAILPILLHEVVTDHMGGQKSYNTKTEYDALKAMETNGDPVDYQEGAQAAVKALVDHVIMQPDKLTGDGAWFQGLCVVRLTIPS